MLFNWSKSFWPLSVTVLTNFVFPVWRNAKAERFAFHDFEPALVPCETDVIPFGLEKRQGNPLTWISLREFLSLQEQFKDVILIDLRQNGGAIPFPTPGSVWILPVMLFELSEVLECIPKDKVVVFYGLSELSMLMIRQSTRMQGEAPVYALHFDLGYKEAA